MIRFLLNQTPIEISEIKPDTTVLDYLREEINHCGTKEGCASGDCGACTVTLAQPNAQGQLSYTSVNSCITYMTSLHGKQLITVEHLGEGETLHPVQQAMVDHHASQCGFCTPGFIMSMFTLYHQDIEVNKQTVNLHLSGNLCRCTGYRPIIDATLAATAQKQPDKFDANSAVTLETLTEMSAHNVNAGNLYLPNSTRELADLIKKHPHAQLFAGSTDLALQSTQFLQDIPCLIDIKNIPEMQEIVIDDAAFTVGAAVPLNKFATIFEHHFPQAAELIERFASMPIRNQATMGGNIANASPIGDLAPMLIALEAILHLSDGTTHLSMPIDTFFVSYKQTKLAKNQWIERIEIPLLKANERLAAYKVSKRIEDDISAVCAVFKLQLNDNIIQKATCGFGGVAAIPSTCSALNDTLLQQDWRASSTMASAKQLLQDAFTPIDDVRASAQYRKAMVGNLWHRFWLESNFQNNTIDTRVIHHA